MSLRHKRRELQGLVGGVGVVVLLGSLIGGFYPFMSALAVALAIWIIGATLVIVLTDPPG